MRHNTSVRGHVGQVLINALTGQMDFRRFWREVGMAENLTSLTGFRGFAPAPKTARLAVGRLRRSYAENLVLLTNCKQIRKNGGGGGS